MCHSRVGAMAMAIPRWGRSEDVSRWNGASETECAMTFCDWSITHKSAPYKSLHMKQAPTSHYTWISPRTLTLTLTLTPTVIGDGRDGPSRQHLLCHVRRVDTVRVIVMVMVRAER